MSFALQQGSQNHPSLLFVRKHALTLVQQMVLMPSNQLKRPHWQSWGNNLVINGEWAGQDWHVWHKEEGAKQLEATMAHVNTHQLPVSYARHL